MATLHARPGDAQAVKALAAARLASAELSVVSAQDVSKSHPSPFNNNAVTLVTASGAQLTESNVIAKFLGAWALGAFADMRVAMLE